MNCHDRISEEAESLAEFKIQNPGNGTGHTVRNISSLIDLMQVAGKFSAGYMSRMVLSAECSLEGTSGAGVCR